MHFWPAFTEFAENRDLQTAVLFIASLRIELFAIPLFLRVFRNHNFARFLQTYSRQLNEMHYLILIY